MRLDSKLILASKDAHTGVWLYTFVLTYPRIILAEVNTHRMLSRNTASSRAIPSEKQRQRIYRNPFVPISIGQNQKGMQAGEELEGWRRWACIGIWRAARYPQLAASWVLDKLGAHKQVANRLVEAWMWCQQVVTATDLNNVFLLRDSDMAEPHFHWIAARMHKQVRLVAELDREGFRGDYSKIFTRSSDPDFNLGVEVVQELEEDEWHLPFVTEEEKATEDIETLKRISTARCARVSYYLPEGGKSNIKRDIEIWERLSTSGHWSPFEHAATPMRENVYYGNFRSWKQYRKQFGNEAGGDR
jgi:hypothetical protein